VRGEETSSAQRREFKTTTVVDTRSDRQDAILLFRRFKLSDLFAIRNGLGAIHVVSGGIKPLAVRLSRGVLKSVEGLVVRFKDCYLLVVTVCVPRGGVSIELQSGKLQQGWIAAELQSGKLQQGWIAAIPASRNETAVPWRLASAE
jgi:hypothetical protein